MSNQINQITKYVDGELYCDVYECPQTPQTLKFVAYGKEDMFEYKKNYWILYECKWCGRRWFKHMTDKADPNPVWSYCLSEEESARIEFETQYDL